MRYCFIIDFDKIKQYKFDNICKTASTPSLREDSLPAEPQGKPKNTGVGSHSLLQGFFLAQGLNPGLPHCRRFLYQMSHKGSPRILEWVAIPFSRGSSQLRDGTEISHIEHRFFTSWATRKAREYWSEYPIPSPADLPDTGIKPGSPALQPDSLPTELSGKPTGR